MDFGPVNIHAHELIISTRGQYMSPFNWQAILCTRTRPDDAEPSAGPNIVKPKPKGFTWPINCCL